MAVFLLLAVIIALPAIGVLYFMIHAMENERLGVRQKLSEAYQSDLDTIRLHLQEYWNAKQKELDTLSTDTPPAALFREIVRGSLCDSALVLNTTGEVVYPMAASRAADEAALTLRNETAHLLKSGSQAEALRILTGDLQAPDLRQSADSSGRLVGADALLLALRSFDDRTDPRFAVTFEQLKQSLNDYELGYFPSRQRLFLMNEVMKLGAGAEFPTYQAELLAQTYLESATASGLSRVSASDGRVLALFKPERMLSESYQAMGTEEAQRPYAVSLESHTETSNQPPAFLSVTAPPPLSGYTLALRLTGPDPFEQATHSQILAYRLAGGGVILVTLIVAVWIAWLLSRQIRLARLRNDLIATVSHELRTPLASVRLLVDTLLAGRVSGEEATREYLAMISRESQRLSGLIDNFLTFSRMERNKMAFERKPLDPRELIDSALESLSERLSRPGVHLSPQVDSGLSPLQGDRDALVTLLVNLLDNALKYTGAEKAIALRASQVDEDIVFEVADNGIGIPRRALRRIFKRFYQVDRSLSRGTGGCGLGLAIVDFIVRGHDGRIRVESEVGKGSRFIVFLPVSPLEKGNGGQDTRGGG